MKFEPTDIAGLYVIELDRLEDDRGFFARTFCDEEFGRRGLCTRFVQCNVSFNARRGTLRGMHLQRAPHEEVKLVRCTRGAVYDVVLDLRPASATFKRWQAFELTADNHRTLYVDSGLAHGFQTLEDDSELFYQMSARYDPPSAHGVRWNDPAFAIHWPLEAPMLSPRDAGYPDFDA